MPKQTALPKTIRPSETRRVPVGGIQVAGRRESSHRKAAVSLEGQATTGARPIDLEWRRKKGSTCQIMPHQVFREKTDSAPVKFGPVGQVVDGRAHGEVGADNIHRPVHVSNRSRPRFL